MHIGINATRFSVNEPGGAIQAGIQSANALLEIVGEDTTVFGHHSSKSLLNTSTIRHPLNLSRSRPFGMVWERTILPLEASRCGIDVLYSPNANGPVFNTGFSNVICIHDVNAQRGFSNSTYQKYKRMIIPRTADVSDAIVTVSEFSKQEICDVYNLPKSKVHVVYNGIDSLFFSESAGAPLDLPDDYILYVGAMNPRKNIKGVISAYKKLKATSNLPHELVLIGPKNTAAFDDIDLELSPNIVLPGYISKDQLKFAYESADAFVFPSFYEGFGLPPLEAMACGTPVVASNTSSLSELLEDAALLVDPNSVDDITDALNATLHDEALRNKLISNGKDRAKRFTWEASAERLLEVFQDVV